VAVVLTLVQTKQIRINIHKRNNTKNRAKTMQNEYIALYILPKHPQVTKVKQSRYRPGVAQRVPGSKGSQIS
jgi:hypothetical protein